MFTLPYDPTRDSLLHPGKADDFFQHGPIGSEAALCAEMSRLVYVKETDRLRKYLATGGFALVTSIGYETKGTQAFVARSMADSARQIAVVAFRGTEPDDPTDLFTDARFAKVAWTPGGNVHSGFSHALGDAFTNAEELEGTIPKSVDRVLFTGHSLGAALATLAASMRPPDHLYTFGSPRVGDADFARSMHGVDHARYVDCCDLVARVPPESFGYVHTGALRYIDRDGKVLSAPDDEAIEQDQRAAASAYLFRHALLRGTVPLRELADHAPINYLSAVMGLRP